MGNIVSSSRTATAVQRPASSQIVGAGIAVGGAELRNNLVWAHGQIIAEVFDPAYTIVGDGAGGATPENNKVIRNPKDLHARYSGAQAISSPWPMVKVITEYGLLSMLAFIAFYVSGILGNFNVLLKVALSLEYGFTGGYLLNPIMVQLLVMLLFIIAPSCRPFTRASMSHTRSSHIVELQSVRGIAATAVMLGHAVIYYDTPSWFSWLAALSNGRAAVVVFFVLSGCVLTRSLRSSNFDYDAVIGFYIQRFFRIYPAIWAASTLGLLYIFLLHWQIPVAHTGELIRSQFRVDRFDALHIVASIAGMTTFILPPLWTIFIEIVASIAIPGIAFVALHRQRWYGWMLAAALVVTSRSPTRTII